VLVRVVSSLPPSLPPSLPRSSLLVLPFRLTLPTYPSSLPLSLPPSLPPSLQVRSMQNVNRALDGDVVAVEILLKQQ